MRMNPKSLTVGQSYRFAAAHLELLFKALHSDGYMTIGPKAQNGAIQYDELKRADELPIGWTEEQEKGSYRLKRRDEPLYFGYTVGPDSWKKFLFPDRQLLWRAKHEDGKLKFTPNTSTAKRLALIGVRGCDLRAIEIQEQVRTINHQPVAHRQQDLTPFIIGINCIQAAPTCFCTSMGAGPTVGSGCDLELTELYQPGSHCFVVVPGTARGADLLAAVPVEEATAADAEACQQQVCATTDQITRKLDTHDISGFLAGNLDNSHWDKIAEICLSCANCTLVCPTCFCSTVEDHTDLNGDHASRWLKWDSCFSPDFSHIHGGSVRVSTKSRYRQWLTHKLGTWWDQFGSSGCVGCGRCIAWCPVGIDLTEEIPALRAAARAQSPLGLKKEDDHAKRH